MTLIYKNLYNNIISKNAEQYSNLRVITGYSSGNFIRRVFKDFPNMKLDLYLGMARQGILERDHKYYQDLTTAKKARVSYVTEKPFIHQKVLEFYGNGSRRYLGSANFSYSGFESQCEVMLETTESVEGLFRQAKKQSILCTDTKIPKYIPLLKDQTAIYECELTDERDNSLYSFEQPSFEFKDIGVDNEVYLKVSRSPLYKDFLDGFKDYEQRISIANSTLQNKDVSKNGRGGSYKRYLIKALVNYYYYFGELPKDMRSPEVGSRLMKLMETPSFKKVNVDKNRFYSAAIHAYLEYVSK